MKLITKISITASVLLFVLAQLFSIFIIFSCQKQKLTLIEENENVLLNNNMRYFSNDVVQYSYEDTVNETILNNIIVYAFRENALENSAIFVGEECLYNNSPYDINKTYLDSLHNKKTEDYDAYGGNIVFKEKINGQNFMIFELKVDYSNTNIGFSIYHILDVTDIYEESRQLVIKELGISFIMCGIVIIILNILIQRITTPLKNINETQRQLIGGLSHELKTPITAMKGYSETILKVNISKDQEEKALNYIYTECSRLSRLTEKMMDLTKLYEPECKVELEPVNVKELIDSVKIATAHNLMEKNITLQVLDIPSDLEKNLDKDLMMSLIINLINNGITASDNNSTIYVGADSQSIWVEDEGRGIPKPELENVKKAFYRVDKSRSRKSGNMGLGLSLCEKIAEVHKATLHIESEEGKGTKVTFVY